MIKIFDLANIMGATVTYNGNYWYLLRNQQTTTFTKNTTVMSTSNSYYCYDPVNGVYDYKSFTWNTVLPLAAQEINGLKYVPLLPAAKQLGALLAEPVWNGYCVYDFRINGTTPFADSNQYIVGGDWITNWSGKAGDNLSDHFDIGEMWSNPTLGYARQLKIAVPSLESTERVRYYYNNNSSMYLDCAFRSWAWNISMSNSAVNSFHMRGRAWDCGTDALYFDIKDEFSDGNGLPIDAGGYWRSYIPSSSNSKGYEIEKMIEPDSAGNQWLHLQRQPGVDTAGERP